MILKQKLLIIIILARGKYAERSLKSRLEGNTVGLICVGYHQ